MPTLEQQPCAGAFVRSEFVFRDSAGGGLQRSAAAPREIGYRTQRFSGASIALKQQS